MSCANKEGPSSKAFNTSDDFDALLDDAMLDDEDDDFLCSQFNLADIPGLESPAPKIVQPPAQVPISAPRVQPPPPKTPQFQPRPVNTPYQHRPVTPQHRPSPSPYRPQTPSVVRPPQPPQVAANANGIKENENSPESKLRDQLQGEILWLKDRLEIATKQLEEERKAKQKIYEEREAALAEFKAEADKKLNNIQSKLDFKEHDYKHLKMKIDDLERQLKTNQKELDNQISSKPLPYSLPIVMHRSLDFTPNKGFVDWDDKVTFDDILDHR